MKSPTSLLAGSVLLLLFAACSGETEASEEDPLEEIPTLEEAADEAAEEIDESNVDEELARMEEEFGDLDE